MHTGFTSQRLHSCSFTAIPLAGRVLQCGSSNSPPPPPPDRPPNRPWWNPFGSDQNEQSHGIDHGWGSDDGVEWGTSQQYIDNEALNDKGQRRTRDTWLNPMLDRQSVIDVFQLRDDPVIDRLQLEGEVNRWESRQAVKYVAIFLVILPLMSGYFTSRFMFEPALNVVQAQDPAIFHMSEKQLLEGARKVHIEELRLRLNVAVGKTKKTQEIEILAHLHDFAMDIKEESEERNRQGLINVVSDSVSLSTFVLALRSHTRGRRILTNTFRRVASGVSQTAKAFTIILVADILLGYHSEEGWASFINMLTKHYGVALEAEPIYLFIAIVPVCLDAFFKWWIFQGLNRMNPSSVVTLKEMNRH